MAGHGIITLECASLRRVAARAPIKIGSYLLPLGTKKKAQSAWNPSVRSASSTVSRASRELKEALRRRRLAIGGAPKEEKRESLAIISESVVGSRPSSLQPW